MAFEPMPDKAEWLRKKFPEVEVHAKALGAEPGLATLSINQTRSGLSGLKPFGDASDEFTEMDVEIARLDDPVPADREISFLKIVVEGAELSVLQGAVRVQNPGLPTTKEGPSQMLATSSQARQVDATFVRYLFVCRRRIRRARLADR